MSDSILRQNLIGLLLNSQSNTSVHILLCLLTEQDNRFYLA
jgi:hypothetical protein